MADTLYREEILEHYRNPQHFGKPKSHTVSSKQTNPFCGDEVELFFRVKNDVVTDVGFEGVGCAISIAAASILTEFTLGKSREELTKFDDFDMLSLLGIEVSETRKKCALLALSVLRDCLSENPKSQTLNSK